MQRLCPVLALCVLSVAGDAAARNRHTINVRLPRVSLPAGSNVELCYFVKVPTTTPFMLGAWRIVHAGAKGGTQPLHGLVYVYAGERVGDFPNATLVSSRGCLDLGPDDRDRRILVASGAARKVQRVLPVGVAAELAPAPDAPGGPPAGIGILVDVNWFNTETRAKNVSTKVVLRRAKKRVARVARPLFDRSAGAGIFAPPFTRQSTAELVDARWSPAGDACLLGLSTQMHRRGRCAGIEQLDPAGQVRVPARGTPNPCEPDQREELFVAADYTDPGALGFTTPFPVRAGEALRYSCWTDNGLTAGTVRLGCEETPGVTPGSVADGPAAVCSLAVAASGECGGRPCVPANAVAGPSADDELCGITALVYDAAPGGGCDVSSLK